MGHAHPAPGVSIDFFAAGDGPALVLLHGIAESRRSWDPLIAPLLAVGYRVIALDQRGHGASSVSAPFDVPTLAGDLDAVLDQLGVSDALLVGHSLGGAVAAVHAGTGRCRGIVIVDQPLLLSDFQVTLRHLETTLRGTTAEFQSVLDVIFEALVGPLPNHEQARIRRLRTGRQDVVLGVWDAVLSSSEDDLTATVEAVLGAIAVPYLSLHGIDPGSGFAEWLTGHTPSATVELWPNHGHYPHLADPARFVQRVVDFDPAHASANFA